MNAGAGRTRVLSCRGHPWRESPRHTTSGRQDRIRNFVDPKARHEVQPRWHMPCGATEAKSPLTRRRDPGETAARSGGPV
jgi:hypothetical protein